MGGLFAVVGPSGAGKDSLMYAARSRLPEVHLVRRVITRPEEAGGENFEGVSVTEFDRRLADGAFALHWHAHGLRYGIPSEVHELVGAGRLVLFNCSRAMLTDAAQVFPDQLRVIHLSARREILAQRLAARGRETAADVEKRLDRARLPLPAGLNVIEIDNSGALEDAVDRFLRALQPLRA